MSVRSLAVATASLVFLAPQLSGQATTASTIASGVWRGWMVRADLDSVRVSWQVEQRGKDLTIVLRSPGNADYGMGDVKLKNDVLTFNWAMGQDSYLSCRLSRRGGPGFDGICEDARRDSQGGRSRIFVTMNPPTNGGRGTRPDSVR